LAQVVQALGSAGRSSGTREEQSDDQIAKLEGLAKLRDGGVISGVEFEQQKQRILGSGRQSRGAEKTDHRCDED
jgi:hypothetical protein